MISGQRLVSNVKGNCEGLI